MVWSISYLLVGGFAEGGRREPVGDDYRKFSQSAFLKCGLGFEGGAENREFLASIGRWSEMVRSLVSLESGKR